MKKQATLNPLLILAFVLLAGWVVTVLTQTSFASATFGSPLATPLFNSPLPTPNPSPTPLPGPSVEAQRALAYIAQRRGIPAKDLVVVTDHPTEYPNLGRKFQVVTVLDTRPDGRFYDLLVDLRSGYIEEDLSALLAAEDRAYLARYGKLEPALHERLQQVSDDQVLPVAIWIAGKPRRTQEAIFASLAARFPEAQAALARFDKPMAVDDPALAARIRVEYNKMLAEDTAIRIAPLMTHLQQRGASVVTYSALPSVTTWLTKRQILELARRNDVGMIYLIEEQGRDEVETAIPTDLVPIVWDRGFDGTGVTVAILEDGNIDPNTTCLNVSATRNSPNVGPESHKTMVGGIVACDHATYRGVAPGATLVDAGFDSSGGTGMSTQQDAVAALQWAVVTQSAPIVNSSFGFEADNNLHWTDRAFDYWARHEFVLIAKSAGNTAGSITSPGKGWNLLTVGGTNDQNNANWSDDIMWASSAYSNPSSPNGDREKPEVVAVASTITTIDLGGNPNPVPREGTSFAAPQVAGLTALLIDRDGILAAWPEASRAIIMASATHNIVGPTGIPTGQELQDGAGAINAAFADDIAQNHNTSPTTPCEESCWWGSGTSGVPEGDYLYRYFNASVGQYIRVAISWCSRADSPGNNYSFDRLDTDLRLGVQYYNGSWWEWVPGAWSASWDNNYELVEFVAPETGSYRIAVHKAHVYNNETSNFVGIALLKLHRVYLPTVMRNYP